MREPLSGVRLGEGVVAALRLAATEASDDAQPVGVSDLLSTLSRTDLSGDWSRVLLHLGEPAAQSEPLSETAGGDFDGVALSGALCDALDRSCSLMRTYAMPVLEPGLLGLMLVRSLEQSDSGDPGVDFRSAERAMIDDVLGVDLTDLERALAEIDPAPVRPEGQAAPLLAAARARCTAGGEPGAAELVEAIVEREGPVHAVAGDLVIDLDGKSSSSELAGIPDASASTVLASAAAHPVTGTLEVDAVLVATTAPSWKVFEMMQMDGCRPIELAAALGLAETEALDLWSLVGRDADRFLRWPLRIWVAYMVIRHREFAAAGVLLVPMIRPPVAPPWLSLLGCGIALALFGWVPAALAGLHVAIGSLGLERDRRRLSRVLRAKVAGSTFRRILRVVDGRRSAAIDFSQMRRSLQRQRRGLAP